jgi:uncharacterized alpha-E superfamily protein/hemerythrin-like domain-containing protein
MLLSSSAQTMFWLGRHLERAQALSRAIQSSARASLDLPGADSPALAPLLGLVGKESVAEPGEALYALSLERDNPSSVLGALGGARENLRRGRTIVAPEAWEILNGTYLKLCALERAAAGSEILRALDHVMAASSRIEGELGASMTRDGAYAFLRIGWLLERADMMLRVTSALSEGFGPGPAQRDFDDVRWMGVLNAVGAYAMYRRRHHARVDQKTALDFVLLDAEFPSSTVCCILQIERELEKLPRPQRARAALLSCLPEPVEVERIETMAQFRALAAKLLTSIAGFHGAIAASYFPSGRLPGPETSRAERQQPFAADAFSQLEREHREMDKLLGVVDQLSLEAERGDSVDRTDLEALLMIVRDWGQLGHHEKEEDVLTPMLVAHGFDWYDGPLAFMRRQHRQERYLFRCLEDLSSQREQWSSEARRSFASMAREYASFMREHMRREETDLFELARSSLPAEAKAALRTSFQQFDAELKRTTSPTQVREELQRLLHKYGAPAAGPRIAFQTGA